MRASGWIRLFLFFAVGTSAYAADQITVVDESNKPVANATIMLGYEPGNPFKDNVFHTDSNGVAGAPDDWKAALPLTVQADGFITSTVPVAMPGMQTLVITHQEPQTEFEVKGMTTGYGNLITDGKVDFGMVIPGIRRDQMLSFDVASIVSPRGDQIDIIGNKVDIPSNIALPRQRENYVFPITFDKPAYRMYVRQPGQYTVGITHGQFPLQRVVNDIRNGKSFLDVVNYFEFKQGGSRAVDVQGNTAGIDMAVNSYQFGSAFSVQAPAYDSKLAMISLGLVEQGDVFLPTDVKRLTPGQKLNMKTNNTIGPASLLSVLIENVQKLTLADGLVTQAFGPLLEQLKPMAQPAPRAATPDFNKMSFALVPASGGAAPQFLPLVNPPTLNGQIMNFEIPALPNGLAGAAMYLTLSEIELIPNGNVNIERRTRLWEVWSEAWLNQMEMPKIAINRKSDRKYRWEVLFLARPANFVGEKNVGPRVDLKSITHATRNSVDI